MNHHPIEIFLVLSWGAGEALLKIVVSLVALIPPSEVVQEYC